MKGKTIVWIVGALSALLVFVVAVVLTGHEVVDYKGSEYVPMKIVLPEVDHNKGFRPAYKIWEPCYVPQKIPFLRDGEWEVVFKPRTEMLIVYASEATVTAGNKTMRYRPGRDGDVLMVFLPSSHFYAYKVVFADTGVYNLITRCMVLPGEDEEADLQNVKDLAIRVFIDQIRYNLYNTDFPLDYLPPHLIEVIYKEGRVIDENLLQLSYEGDR